MTSSSAEELYNVIEQAFTLSAVAAGNGTMNRTANVTVDRSALADALVLCTRDRAVLCVLLMLGTLWVGYTLYQFKRRYSSCVLKTTNLF